MPQITLHFDSDEDRHQWMEWYSVIGEQLSRFIVNYDLMEGPPWNQDAEGLEFEMVQLP